MKANLALVLLLAWGTASADIFTVGEGGSHSTINQAVAAALALGGDNEIRLRSGVYNENAQIDDRSGDPFTGSLRLSGGWDAAFDNRESNPALTIIDGGGEGECLHVFLRGGTLEIRGLTTRNGNGFRGGGLAMTLEEDASASVSSLISVDNHTSSLNGAGLQFQLNDASRLELSEAQSRRNLCNGERAIGAGLKLTSTATATWEIRNSVFEANRAEVSDRIQGGGISLTLFGDSRGLFVDSRVEDTIAQAPGQVLGSGARLNPLGNASLEVRRVRITGNLRTGDDPLTPQISAIAQDSAGLIMTDSLIADGNGTGLLGANTGDRTGVVRFANLTIADHLSSGAALSSCILENSIVFGQGQASSFSSVTQNANLIDVDPLFVDAGSGDYRVLPGSPAIDAGEAGTPDAGSIDLEGLARVAGSGPDVGAYEFQDGEETFYLPQIGNGDQLGIGFTTSIEMANRGAAASAFSIEFFDPSGNPVDFGSGLSGLGAGTRLEPGESFSGTSSGSGDLLVGYAVVRKGPDIGGIGIFAQSDSAAGQGLFRTGVPLVRPLAAATVFIDTRGFRDTGIALVHPRTSGPSAQGSSPAVATLRLLDRDGNLLATRQIELAAGQHLARFVTELFPDAPLDEFEGLLTIESTLPLAILTLQREDDPNVAFPPDVPTLTTLPTLEGRPRQ